MKFALQKFGSFYALCVIFIMAGLLASCSGGGGNSNSPSLLSTALITSYSINTTNGVTPGVISGQNITVTVPFGATVTSLVASFATTTSAVVSINNSVQLSGITTNNFTSPLTYNVVGLNGVATTYKVTVLVASVTSKAITSYSINNVNGIITGQNIVLVLPFGSSLTNLIATFATSGTNVTIGSTKQLSATTANNFTSPLSYVVTASDGSTATYVVTVTVASVSSKSILAYSINNVPGVITGQGIVVTLPTGTNVTNLIATYIATASNVAIGTTPQSSGTTVNNFTSPVPYTITAADGSIATYTVTVLLASASSNFITGYSINNIPGVITGQNIVVTVPFGTDVTGLIATFAATGTNITVGNTTQVSTVTPNNFTGAVTYTVTASNGTTSTYTVTVVVASNSANAITSYSINNVPGVITGTNILVTLPVGTNVTALIATFASAAPNVTVGGTQQFSAVTPNNFTSLVSYTVTAVNGSVAIYTVTVTIASVTANAITSYSINGRNGIITGTNIAVGLPFGTNVSALIATFASTGTGVAVGSIQQFSTVTPNNFTSPVAYVVTAANGNTATYTVTVTVSTVPTALHIFVTNQTSTGNLMAAANGAGGAVTNGVAGADYLCQVDAQCPTGSTCKAMLISYGIQSPVRQAAPTLTDWVLRPATAYYNMAEALIGTTNGASVFNFPLTVPFGTVGANPLTWTALNPDWTSFGSPTGDCSDWTILSSTATSVGNTAISNNLSISNIGPNCSTPYALYCVQQGSVINIYAGIVSAPGVPTSGAIATATNLSGPQGLAVDTNGNLYIADTTNNRIEKVNPSTGILTVIAGGGSVSPILSNQGNIGTFYTLSAPKGVAVDSSGNVYVADTTDQFIEKLTPSGATYTLTIVAGNGSSGTPILGAATGSPLNLPQGVAVDSINNILYIADTGNSLIEKVTLSNGILSIYAGKLNGVGAVNPGLPTPGAATSSQLNSPHGVAVDGTGAIVYIADTGNNIVEKVVGNTLSIFAGSASGTAGSPSVGPATSSLLRSPGKVAIATNGNVFIADTLNNYVEQVNLSGVLSIFAGTGAASTPTPGGAATNSALNNPNGVAVYGAGNVYIGDTLNNVIEKAN